MWLAWPHTLFKTAVVNFGIRISCSLHMIVHRILSAYFLICFENAFYFCSWRMGEKSGNKKLDNVIGDPTNPNLCHQIALAIIIDNIIIIALSIMQRSLLNTADPKQSSACWWWHFSMMHVGPEYGPGESNPLKKGNFTKCFHITVQKIQMKKNCFFAIWLRF